MVQILHKTFSFEHSKVLLFYQHNDVFTIFHPCVLLLRCELYFRRTTTEIPALSFTWVSFHQGLLQHFACSRPLLAQVHDQSKKRCCRHCLVSLELFQGILLIVLKSWGSCFGKTTAIVSNFEGFSHESIFSLSKQIVAS